MNRIRRILLLIAVIILTVPFAGAQLRYGIRLGGSFAKASLKDATTGAIDNGSGFSGGLMLEYQMPGKGFATDVAVLYTRYNIHFLPAGGGKQDFGRNFIEIPLHLKYKFWLPAFHNLFGPLIYTGPSLMLRAGSGESQTVKTDTFQPGWDVGIGLDIVNFIQLTGGYRFGIGNAAKDFKGSPDARLHTDGWNIAANIIFDF